MNFWTKLSVDYASQKNYLDELYPVYPIVPNPRRTIKAELWNQVEIAYHERDDIGLVKSLLKLKLFPLKDSYVAHFRKDPSSIGKNPNTLQRIVGNLYQMPLEKIYQKCTEPKETNRQIGPMFKKWLSQGTLGCDVYTDGTQFLNTQNNAVLNMSDAAMKNFAIEYLGYKRVKKGLDFIARFHGKYIIAETKFLTDFGGHQYAQFEDAVTTMNYELAIPNKLNAEVIRISIMDGALYIAGKNKMYKHLQENPNEIILSALVLKEFLYSI